MILPCISFTLQNAGNARISCCIWPHFSVCKLALLFWLFWTAILCTAEGTSRWLSCRTRQVKTYWRMREATMKDDGAFKQVLHFLWLMCVIYALMDYVQAAMDVWVSGHDVLWWGTVCTGMYFSRAVALYTKIMILNNDLTLILMLIPMNYWVSS